MMEGGEEGFVAMNGSREAGGRGRELAKGGGLLF